MRRSAERRGSGGRARWFRRLHVAGLLLLSCSACWAATGNGPVPLGSYLQEIAAARQRVAACAQTAAACDPTALLGAQQVDRGAGASFRVSWEWLGDTLNRAKNASAADRARAMAAAEQHLQVLASEASGSASSDEMKDFGQAQKAAKAVLARREFRAAAGPSWMERQLARLEDWVLRLFSGADRLGHRAPWLAPLIEWGCFALAAAGLLWFLWRSLARQSLRISLGETARVGAWNERAAADWRQRAAQQAGREDWREAIHSLYWAAVALLESRRAWRPNSTRTPREYLQLLRSGTEAQTALRELTQSLEAVWYGRATADAARYRAAQASFDRLQQARMERASSTPDRTDAASLAAAGSL